MSTVVATIMNKKGSYMELRLPHWLPAPVHGEAHTVAAAASTNSQKHSEGVSVYVRQMVHMLV